MQFRDDIIRGIRLAAIAFAVLLIGLIGYRVLHETPAPRLAPPRDIAPPIPSIKPKVPEPLAVPAPPRAKADVTPRKAALHRVPVKKESTSTPPVPVVHNADVDPAPPQFEEIPVRPVAVNVLTIPEVVPEQAEDSEVPKDVPQEKSGNRGKRALRAVGRFLHIGK